MVETVYLNIATGLTTVQDNRLVGATALTVSLEDTYFDIVYTTPSGRQVRYRSAQGELEFGVAAPASLIGAPLRVCAFLNR